MKKLTLKKFTLLISLAFLTLTSSFGQIVLNESFRLGALPVGWSESSVSLNDAWEYGGGVDFGSTSVIPDPFGNLGQYTNMDFSDDPDTTSLITPKISVAGLTNPRLTFYYITQTNNTLINPYNRLILDYWNGTAWTNITVIDTLTTQGWTEYLFDATPYIFNVDSVQFRFSAQEGGAAIGGFGTETYDQDMALDDITIEATPSCAEPINLSTTNLTTTSAQLNWVDTNGAPLGYQVSYGLPGFDPNSGTMMMTTADSLIISNLTNNTSYEWVVRTICAVGDTSYWTTGVLEFTTLISCLAPTSLITSEITDTSADFSWTDPSIAMEWQISYGVSGFTAGNGTQMVVTTDSVSVSGLTQNTNYDWYVRTICSRGDTSTWSSASFTTLCGVAVAPFFDGFENHQTRSGITGLTECWEATRQNISNDWNIDDNGSTPSSGTGPSGPFNGSKYAYFEASSGSAGAEATFTSPKVLVNGLTQPMVEFYVFMFGDNRGVMSDLYIDMFDGSTYTVLDSIKGEQQSSPLDPWLQIRLLLPTTTDTVQIRLRAYRGSAAQYGDIAIDDFSIKEAPSCFNPTSFSLSAFNITTSTVDVTWDQQLSGNTWEIEWDTIGFTPGIGRNSLISINDTATLTGLSAATAYDWYVRNICAPGDTSIWSTKSNFITECPAFTAPYFTDFDAVGTGTFNSADVRCWQATGIGADDVFIVNATDHGAAIPSTPNTVELNDGIWPSDTSVLVSPEFSDLNSGLNRIRFQAAFENVSLANVSVFVGVITDPTDVSTFTPIDTISAADVGGTTDFGEIIIRLTNTALIGSARHIAFIHGPGGFEAYIDDFNYEPIPPNDLTIAEIVRPANGCNIASDSVEIAIANIGTAPQSNFTVGFDVDGGTTVTETFTGTIAPGDTVNFVFNALANLTIGGTSEVSVYTMLGTDADNRNDSLVKVVTSSNFASLPYTESFETGAAGWVVSGDSSWEVGTPAGAVIDTASDGTQAWVTDLDAQYANRLITYVNSPCFDFRTAQNPYIKMDIWYDIENRWDGAVLEASIDGGNTWTVVGAKNDPVNWYNDSARIMVTNNVSADGRAWTSSLPVVGGSGWVTAEHALDGLSGQSSVKLRVAFHSDEATSEDGMAFDNVRIFDSIPQDPYYPIGVINTEDAQGIADSLNVTCFTSGTVVGIDLDGNSGISFYIIDQSSGSQEGINVFNFNDVSNYVVNEGDSILVHGDIAQFNGLTEIVPDSISIIGIGNALPTPIVVTDLDETTESKYLSIPTSYWALNSSGTGSSNVNLTNGTDTIIMRIDSDTDINDSLNASNPILPNDTICGIVGIGSQFDNVNPPATLFDGYQVFPMRWADLTICRITTGIDNVVTETATFSLSPNPTNGEFMISSNGFNNATVNIIIRDINGRVLSNDFISNANSKFNKSFDLNGESKGMYFISVIDGENVFNKKIILQ